MLQTMSRGDSASDLDTGSGSNVVSHGDSADFITIPDAALLFSGDFKRSGTDLILSDQSHEFVVHDYFRSEKRPTLMSPDGATLSGAVVESLASHVQYAQAGAAPGAGAATAIGRVAKMDGNVTAIRNGVAVTLNAGDAVNKGDVIQTGSNSSISLSFADGTALNLSASTRMALNEFVYDPGSNSNGGVFSLVQGGFAFVAGQVAKTGGLNIETPVATMGIRGTIGGGSCAEAGKCEFYAHPEFNGQASTYTLMTGGTFVNGQYVGGTVVGTVTVGANAVVNALGANQPPQITFVPASNADPGIAALASQLVTSYSGLFSQPTQPTGPSGGSSTPPPPPPNDNPGDQPLAGLPPPTTVVSNTPGDPVIHFSPPPPPPPDDTPPPPPPPSNQSPEAQPIQNQSSPEDALWSFTIPAGTFSDPDSPSLTLAAAQVGGDALPFWLSFNPATGTFTGTPPANANGTVQIEVVASDGSASVASLFTLTVTALNDAPTVTIGHETASLAPILEYAANPSGETVSALVGGSFSDAADQVVGGSSANQLAGIAVTGNATAAEGKWQYFSSGSWHEIGVVSAASALILAADTLIRFVPAPDFDGAAPALTVHLIDDSAGAVSTGSVVNLAGVGAMGGATPYSSGTVAIGETVKPAVEVTIVTPDGYDMHGLYGDIANASPGSHDATHFDAVNSGTGHTFHLVGTGFTYDVNGFTGGTISEIDIIDTASGATLVTETGFAIDAVAMNTAVQALKNSSDPTQLSAILNQYSYQATGSAGLDTLPSFANADSFDGVGTLNTVDYVHFPTGITVNLADPSQNTGNAAGDIYTNINSLIGTNFNDTLIGDANNNALEGGAGADTLDGNGGALNFASYAHANATSGSGPTAVGITANLGNTSQNTGDALGDVYIGINSLIGSQNVDTLIGDGNNNYLRGNGGADHLYGNGGYDTADYRTSNSVNGQGLVVDLSNPAHNTGAAFGDTYDSIENIRASSFNDILKGDSGANVLTGLEGDDTFIYVSGADRVTDFDQSGGSFNHAEGDKIDLTGVAGVHSFADITLTQQDADTVIDFGYGNTLTLAGVTAANLVESDFVFNPEFTEYLSWRHEIDPYAALKGSATKWVIPNSDNLTSTVFTGTGFTYDPITGLPTGGTITSMSLVVDLDHTVLQTMTGFTTTLGQLGTFVHDAQTLRAQISWTDVINTDNSEPLLFTGTEIKFANIDGTFTQILGSGFSQQGPIQGTVSELRHLDTDGTTVLDSLAGLSVSLALGAAAFGPNDAGQQLYLLAGQGANTLTGIHAQVGGTNYVYTNLDSTDGDDIIIGEPFSEGNQNPVGTVNYDDAAAAVQVNLDTGVVTGGSGNDTLSNISSVQGSDFDDTLIGNDDSNSLIGSDGDDHLFGADGDDYLQGGLGADELVGGWGNDTAFYTSYDESTEGVTADLSGSLTNTGEAAGDTYDEIENLSGSSFADILKGDGNANVLTGSGGADTFIYVTGGGADTVWDFDQSSGSFCHAEGDTIDLTGVAGVYSLADIELEQNGLDTFIDFGNGDTLTLQGVAPDDLVADDFVFAVNPDNQAPVLALGQYVEDQFNAQAYDLNTGSVNWAGDWVEHNDDYNATNGSPIAGEIRIANDPTVTDGNFRLFLSDDDNEAGADDTLERTVDLSGATSATLTFDFRRVSFEANDTVTILVSSNGEPFTAIDTIIGVGVDDATYQTLSFDISAYISDSTTIRFAIGDDVDDGDVLYIDNVKIAYSAAPTVVELGASVAILPLSATISDVDDSTMQSATIALTDPQDGDQLTVNGSLPSGITASAYDANTGVLTLSGGASLADYQTALGQIGFATESADASDRQITVTVFDPFSASSSATATVHVGWDVWNGSGVWETGNANWSLGSPPSSEQVASIQSGSTTIEYADIIVAGLVTRDDTQVNVDSNSELVVDQNSVIHGNVFASGYVEFNGQLLNFGQVSAQDYGEVDILGGGLNQGTIEAAYTGEDFALPLVWIEGGTLDNSGGTIAANGNYAEVDLVNTTIVGGTLHTEGGGVILTVTDDNDAASVSTLDGSDQAVTIDCGSFVELTANTTLVIKGEIANAGTIYVDPGAASCGCGPSTPAAYLAADVSASLTGGGQVTLDNASIGSFNGHTSTLTNVDNTISGSGTIGDANLTFTNESSGVVNATGILVIDTGLNAVTNDGLFEVTGGGELQIASALVGSGTVDIDNGTLILGSAANSVIFVSGSDGTLDLLAADDFSGTVSGFDYGDAIDFFELTYSGSFYATYDSGVLTVTDDFETRTVSLSGSYQSSDFVLTYDINDHVVVGIAPPPPANNPPTASDDYQTTDEDTVLYAAFPVSDSDGSIVSYTLIGSGAVQVDGVGNYSFDPTGAYDYLAAGGFEEVSFQYYVTDDQGADSTTQTVTIHIDGLNDAPAAYDDAFAPPSAPGNWSYNPSNGHYYQFISSSYYPSFEQARSNAVEGGGYLATITDADENAFVAARLNGEFADWIGGSDVETEGIFRWVDGPEAGEVFNFQSWRPGEPNNDNNGSPENYVYIDSEGGWNDYSGNDVGYVIEYGGRPEDIYAVDEDGTLTIPVDVLLANDSDPDMDNISIVSVDSFSANGGTVTLDGNIVTYLPAADFNGADSFTYTLSDGFLTSTATVSFEVAPVNDAPVADAGGNSEGHSIGYTLGDPGLALDTDLTVLDVDSPNLQGATIAITDNFSSGDTLIFADFGNITGDYSVETGVLTLSGEASVADYQDAIRSISYQNNDLEAPLDIRTISYTVNDGALDSAAVTSTIVVYDDGGMEDFNQSPTASDDSYTVSEDSTLIPTAPGALVTVDFDTDPFGNPISGAITNQYVSVGVTFSTSVFGLFVAGGGDNGLNGTNSVSYYYNSLPSYSVPSSVFANFIDPATGLDSTTNYVEFTPTDSSSGSTFVMIAYDIDGIEITRVSSFVNDHGTNVPAEDPPLYISSEGIHSVTLTMEGSAPLSIEGDDFKFNAPARFGVLANDTDPENDALTAYIITDPQHGTVTLNEDGTFSYEPDADFAGDDSFTYVAYDGLSDSAEATVNITVTPVNDAPVASNDEALTAPDTLLEVTAENGLLANDADPDVGDTLTVTHITVDGDGSDVTGFVSLPLANGTLIVSNDGSYSFNPAPGFIGTQSFDYTVSSNGDTATATATITVDNRPPGELIINGSFETFSGGVGNDNPDYFDHWTLGGNEIDFYASENTVHGGQYAAAFGFSYLTDETTLSQDVATTEGTHYTLSFWVADSFTYGSGIHSFDVAWNGSTLSGFPLEDEDAADYTYMHYVFDVVGGAGDSSSLVFSALNQGTDYWFLDDVSVREGAPTVEQEIASGAISFTDSNVPHTADVVPDGVDYVGTFTVDSPVTTEPNGATPGAVDWNFDLSNEDLAGILPDNVLTQSYDVTVYDNSSAVATQTVSVSIGGIDGDTFLFDDDNPSLGATTIVNFDKLADVIEIDDYAAITDQQSLLAALGSTGPDATHGDAVINLGNGETVTVAGVTQDYLQQHLNNLVHVNSPMVG